jgi:hypothetical protein
MQRATPGLKAGVREAPAGATEQYPFYLYSLPPFQGLICFFSITRVAHRAAVLHPGLLLYPRFRRVKHKKYAALGVSPAQMKISCDLYS